MEVRQEQCPAPGDVALETVRAWTLWLTEVERWQEVRESLDRNVEAQKGGVPSRC